MTDQHPVVILALNYQEAEHWARTQKLAPRDWVFATEPRHVLGRREFPYVLLPRFWSRSDAVKIMALVRTRAGRAVEVGPSSKS